MRSQSSQGRMAFILDSMSLFGVGFRDVIEAKVARILLLTQKEARLIWVNNTKSQYQPMSYWL